MSDRQNEKQDQPGRPARWKAAASSDAKAPIIVGVGVSAAAVEHLTRFLEHLTPAPDCATVLVMRHREALDEESLQRVLQKHDGLSLSPVRNGAPVEGARIYLPSPDAIVTVKDGRFRTRPSQQRPGERATIDSFLVSLAEDQRERAVAVILDGTTGDGTLGVAAMKEHGGLTIVEQMLDHGAAELAASSSPAALADFLLPAESIPERITTYARHLARLQESQSSVAVAPEVSASLSRIAAILLNKTGNDFHGYKQNTFLRRVQRRMQVVQLDDVEAYADFLRTDPQEALNLFNDLLIGVTQFFRDPREFETLETQVIPQLFDGKGSGDQIRVWVLGCATGEEAYSIGILLREHMAKLEAAPHVQIFATDIDGRALATARVGRYAESIAADVAPQRLARWFVKEGNTYCVVKELREMCIFSAHNVIKDAPFSRLDLISCRNLLIYLNSELQERVIPLFHFALQPGGFLFLGNSENATRHPKLFSPLDRRARIFRRLETATRVLPDFPLSTGAARRAVETAPHPRTRVPEVSLARRAERVAERYTPAYVIIDEQFEVVHFSGRMGRYLDPTSGAANLDILNLVHRDLRLDLRAALHRAAETDEVVRVDQLQIGFNGHRLMVDLVVEPLRDNPSAPRGFVVLFKDAMLRPETDQNGSAASALRDEHVQRLENELRITRERLQATIEELESTNEELKSSNEEYQSLNEELQSANEELETSKEELQSVNEELTTVNGELAHRVQELTRATSDLKNFLESTQIATLFLDNELRVMNFTPAITEIFHLVETDIGRPIAHIKSRVPFEELHEDIRRVLRTLATIEREIENPVTGGRYIVRVLPYRSIDNFIAGVVVTFVDVTLLTRAQKALRESEERFRTLAELSPAGILIDVSGRLAYANPAAVRLLGASSADEILGRSLYDLIRPEYHESTRERITQVGDGRYTAPAEVRFDRLDRATIVLEATAGPITWDERPAMQILLRDVSERQQADERQRLLLAELQHRVQNTLAVVRSIVRRSAETSETVEEYAMHLDGRLNAFARTQGVVTRNPLAGVDLQGLVAEELISYQAHEGEQVSIEGPVVRLQPKAAELMTLAVHELATNAVKYGALATPAGRITVNWQITNGQDRPQLVFNWVESGVTIGGTAPRRQGFGTEMLERTLTYELRAKTILAIGPAGLQFEMELPLSERIVVPDGAGGRSS